MFRLGNGSGLEPLCGAAFIAILCIQKSELVPIVILLSFSLGFGWFLFSRVLWKKFGCYYSLWAMWKDPKIISEIRRVGMFGRKSIVVTFYLILLTSMPILNLVFGSKKPSLMLFSTVVGVAILTFLIFDFFQEYFVKTNRLE